MCICKHCFLPMLLVSAMKCCTKMPCPLPHNHYCCLLSSPICLPHLLICACLISSPIACPPSSVLCLLMSIAFFVVVFYFCYMLHVFVTPFWIVCVHIFVWLVFVPLHYFVYVVFILLCLFLYLVRKQAAMNKIRYLRQRAMNFNTFHYKNK